MARNFDGVDDFLDAGNPTALNLTGDEVTLSIWIKRASGGGAKIFSKWSPSGQQYLLSITSTNAIFAINNGSSNSITGSIPLSIGVWYHIAGVYDGSEMRLYVDGVEDSSLSTSGNMPSTSQPVRIGSRSNGGDNFDGDIGHCAIWDVGLSDSEVESLANGINPLNIRSESRIFYAPINGQDPEYDVAGGLDLTVNGSTKADEPPIPNSIKAP